MVSANVIDAFREIDVPCIGDALRGLGLNCIEPGIKPLERTWTMCGPAVTMRLVPLQDPSRWFDRERHPRELVRMAAPGDILVIDQGGDVDYTIWGGNVASNDGVEMQLGGVVIDGACRDQHAVIESGIPTFVRGTTPMHGHGVYGTTCFNSEPVRLGRISVAPGDLVIGDADGVLVVPLDRAEEILQRAQERHELDTSVADGSPEDADRRNRLRNRLYGIPDPPPRS
jgi:regulator of RNase E activity RraA